MFTPVQISLEFKNLILAIRIEFDCGHVNNILYWVSFYFGAKTKQNIVTQMENVLLLLYSTAILLYACI